MKKNILANLFGNALTAIVSIVCIPLYVHFLGMEAFGLIGIFTSLQVIFSVLDMGLSATLNREFARLTVQEDPVPEQRNLLRTFEYIYFTIAILIAIAVFFSSGLISRHWLTGNSIPPQTIKFVLIQMGVLLALRWPTALYAGGLTGLQKQVVYNVINTLGEIIKALGAVIILAFFRSSIEAFFYWQIFVTGLIVATLHIVLWKKISLPDRPGKAFFSKALLLKNKAFASGMGATSLAVIILTQTDKIVLSKILDLKNFGYYTLASALASSLYRVIVPVSQAVYPRIIQLVHSKDDHELIKTYHFASQLIAVIVLPASLMIAFFSKEIVLIWTHNPDITNAVYPLLSVLIMGTACNALVTIPYMTQLAYGWTKLGLYQNIIAIIVLIPSLIFLATQYGAYGAVWVWAVLNACYLVFSMPVMFRKILKTEMWNWYKNDIFIITLMTLIPALILKYIFTLFNFSNTLAIITYCSFSFLIILSCASVSAQYTRTFAVAQYRKFFYKAKI